MDLLCLKSSLQYIWLQRVSCSTLFLFCAQSPDYQRVVDPKPSWQINRTLNFNKAVSLDLDWAEQADWPCLKVAIKELSKSINSMVFTEISYCQNFFTHFSSDPVAMKIDIHSHILPKEWPDLEKVMVINLLNYF